MRKRQEMQRFSLDLFIFACSISPPPHFVAGHTMLQKADADFLEKLEALLRIVLQH